MPWWLTLLVLGLYAWRTRIALERSASPPPWVVLGLALLAVAAVYLEYRTLFGRTSGIVLLVLFSGLKLAEMRTHRDAAVVAFLCYFLVMTNLLYTQSIPTALLMALALLVVTGTLVGLAAPQRPTAANLRSAGLLLAHAAPAALRRVISRSSRSPTPSPFAPSSRANRRRRASATGAARCCGISTAAPGAWARDGCSNSRRRRAAGATTTP